LKEVLQFAKCGVRLGRKLEEFVDECFRLTDEKSIIQKAFGCGNRSAQFRRGWPDDGDRSELLIQESQGSGMIKFACKFSG